MLVRPYCAGAGLTTNAHKARIVQFIVGHIEHTNIIPYIFRAPVSQWIYLKYRVLSAREGAIDLNNGHIGPCWALVASLAGNPGIYCRQLFSQRFYLADAAAFLVTVFIEAKQTFFFG